MLFDMFAETQKSALWPLVPRGMQNGVKAVGEMVANAHRFTLDRPAAMMVQNVSRMADRSFVTALGICRLPFERMWVEFVFRDRSDWMVEAAKHGLTIQHSDDASPPVRLGFYMEEFEAPKIGRTIVVHPAWSHIPPGVDVCRKAMLIDINPEPIRQDMYREILSEVPDLAAARRLGHASMDDAQAFANLAARIDYIIPPYMETYWQDLRREGQAAVQRYEDLTRYDLAAEWKFVLSLLICMNSRNLLSFGEESDYTKLNKARAKSGKRPLMASREIKLSLSKIQRHRVARGFYHNGGPKDAQWVMGHLKVRKTGVFWWSPHARGGDNPTMKSHVVTA